MTPLEFFMLTAKQYDRAQQFYRTHDRKLMEESQGYEKQQLEIFIQAALQKPEMAEFFRNECPFINAKVSQARADLQAKQQQSLF